MLQPKRTKFRKQQKGRMKGNAGRGNQLAFGTFGKIFRFKFFDIASN